MVPFDRARQVVLGATIEGSEHSSTLVSMMKKDDNGDITVQRKDAEKMKKNAFLQMKEFYLRSE